MYIEYIQDKISRFYGVKFNRQYEYVVCLAVIDGKKIDDN